MASTRKPESFVWTDNEVKLLLWLTLNYKASKLQERLNIFCGTNTSIVVVVVMRRHTVPRSKAGGRGVGRWRHRFGKYVDSPSTRKREGCVFGFFHPETRFQKSAFSGAVFSGSVWTVGQNNEIFVRFRKRVFSSGRPLRDFGQSKYTCQPTAQPYPSVLHIHTKG